MGAPEQPRRPQRMDLARAVTIKTGVVERLGKELANYKQEETSFKAKVELMEHSGADEYDIKQQQRVHAESARMIPDTQSRLEKAAEELESLLAGVDAHDDIDDELKARARRALEAGAKA